MGVALQTLFSLCSGCCRLFCAHSLSCFAGPAYKDVSPAPLPDAASPMALPHMLIMAGPSSVPQPLS